ncbi:Crp/Fnr family transcriptional regulator [Streptomyces sp. NPDC000658]|uniref:Crp/Fnr family transcriptional regulator n=1 Tax=Streptomyces sp. NPDC000658 TaxID=3154266 RepID=UPI003325AB11
MGEALPWRTDHTWPAGTYLSQLSQEARQAIFEAGSQVTYGPDELLFREGDPASYLLVIRTGLAKVTASSESGQETLLAIRGPGDVIGELSALEKTPLRSATVAPAGHVTAWRVSHRAFFHLAEEHPDLGTALFRVVTAKLRSATVARVEVHTYSVRVRLARVLLTLADSLGHPHDGGTVLDVALTQAELAALVSASPVSVARALSEFRRAGMLESGYRRLTLRDRAALTEVAHGS